MPVLETARLILRAHTADDFDAMHAMWSDPAMVRHISGTPSTREQSWQRLLRYGGLWPLLGFGYWAVVDRQTGGFAGEVGFANFGRDIEPPLGDWPEAGWLIAPRFQGQAYATEALTAAFGWFEAAFPERETACLIDPDNAPSLAIAEKFGFCRPTETVYRGGSTLILTR